MFHKLVQVFEFWNAPYALALILDLPWDAYKSQAVYPYKLYNLRLGFSLH